jgi:hypothetical protein
MFIFRINLLSSLQDAVSIMNMMATIRGTRCASSSMIHILGGSFWTPFSLESWGQQRHHFLAQCELCWEWSKKKRCSKDILNGCARCLSSRLSDNFIVFLPFPGGYITPLPFGIFPPYFFLCWHFNSNPIFFALLVFPPNSDMIITQMHSTVSRPNFRR